MYTSLTPTGILFGRGVSEVREWKSFLGLPLTPPETFILQAASTTLQILIPALQFTLYIHFIPAQIRRNTILSSVSSAPPALLYGHGSLGIQAWIMQELLRPIKPAMFILLVIVHCSQILIRVLRYTRSAIRMATVFFVS